LRPIATSVALLLKVIVWLQPGFNCAGLSLGTGTSAFDPSETKLK
jgi:hypothetical protein